MPIDYRIDANLRIVFATPRGTLTTEDLFSYQREAWSRPEVAGFNELVDMRSVEKIDFESTQRVKELAGVSASMDDPAKPTKLAVVATVDTHFGLGRMYQAYREMSPGSTREVRVFRTMEEALAWLNGPAA